MTSGLRQALDRTTALSYSADFDCTRQTVNTVKDRNVTCGNERISTRQGEKHNGEKYSGENDFSYYVDHFFNPKSSLTELLASSMLINRLIPEGVSRQALYTLD